jgi:hypothetical protein
MKKFFVMATMMMAAITANAQYEPGTFSVQPRLGFTASMMTNMPKLQISSDKTLDKQPAVGFIVGADMEYQLNELISLSAGLNWAQEGSGWENDKVKDNGITYELKDPKIETSYLNIPITANFYVWKGLALRTGVQMGFLTSAKEKMTIETSGSQNGVNINSTTEVDESIKDQFNKFEISIPVGVSYEFNNHLVLDARYNIGLSKLNKDSAPDDKDSRNGVFSLTLGYKIKL